MKLIKKGCVDRIQYRARLLVITEVVNTGDKNI
ncbi:hypothetical protein C8P70_1552 [Myroides indicus]|uniref:Uncharacterized protein n=1 Tax=Myroides indicus TaxID=1323422 RepID=A0A4R7ELH0_9FLAO|nr:hypothetical protein C8P70_1552 [Myroides indicus]